MKHPKDILTRLKRPRPRRQDKKGSSLALVMMVGAALVVWVLCILPLMATTGTITYGIQGDMDDYLDSRSAIEFCKSELVHMAKTEIPSTFAVIDDGTGNYSAKHKKSGGITIDDETGYQLYVATLDNNDDRNWLDEIALKEAMNNLSDREKKILFLRKTAIFP